MNAATATVNVAMETSELSRVLRVIAKHANACADELANVDGEPQQATVEELRDRQSEWDAAKAAQAERHRRLSDPEK